MCRSIIWAPLPQILWLSKSGEDTVVCIFNRLSKCFWQRRLGFRKHQLTEWKFEDEEREGSSNATRRERGRMGWGQETGSKRSSSKEGSTPKTKFLFFKLAWASMVGVLCGRWFLFVHLWHVAQVEDALNRNIWAILKYAKFSLHLSPTSVLQDKL